MEKSELSRETDPPTVREYDIRFAAVCNLATGLARELERLRPDPTSKKLGPIDLRQEVQRFERELIRAALIRSGGNQTKAAKMLCLKVSTLNTKVKRFRIAIDPLTEEQ